jgi:two-component system, OmpR family, sensor histidine kinase KdpD
MKPDPAAATSPAAPAAVAADGSVGAPPTAWRPGRAGWRGLLVWAVAWALLAALDPVLDISNLALLLVLGAAIAALWLRPWLAVLACAGSVLVFNVAFVPPRGALAVDLHAHALLLATVLGVSVIVSLLMARQRELLAHAQRHALQAEQRRQLGEALRGADDAAGQAQALQQALQAEGSTEAAIWLRPPAEAPHPDAADPGLRIGSVDEAGWMALRLCAQQRRPMGPGLGWHEELAAWVLPLRGAAAADGEAQCLGAAWVPLPRDPGAAPSLPVLAAHAQSLCDLAGAALAHGAAQRLAVAARDTAQLQTLRSTLLAAVAHDHRTPLATILGAATSLQDQGERLSPAQRRQLAATIADEAAQLSRLTDNTLQLARLDTTGVRLQLDWQSAEELVGSVLRRVRQRDPGRRVRARVEQGLPLLRCDAVLIVQLLENLVDNALRHAGGDEPVEVLARRIEGRVLLAVRDRGPGVPPAERARLFQPFARGPQPAASTDGGRRGAGIGLAVCQAIARVHGGELRYRARGHGGASFECLLPLHTPPAEARP